MFGGGTSRHIVPMAAIFAVRASSKLGASERGSALAAVAIHGAGCATLASSVASSSSESFGTSQPSGKDFVKQLLANHPFERPRSVSGRTVRAAALLRGPVRRSAVPRRSTNR